jgi:translocation and assembly module TamB
MGAQRTVPDPDHDRPRRRSLISPRPGRPRRRAPWRRAAAWAGAAALAVLLLGAAVWHREVQSGALAEELRRSVVTQLQQALHRDVRLQGVSGDPLHGFTLRGLAIAERGGFARGVAFSVQEVRLAIRLDALWSPHPDLAALVGQVDLRGPRLAVSRDAAGVWNVADLFARPGGGGGGGGPGFRGRVTVERGSIAFADAFTLRPPFRAEFAHVAGALSFAPPGAIDISLGASGGDGEQARLTGRYRTDGRTSALDVAAANAPAARWGPYFVRLPALGWLRGRFGGDIHVALPPQAPLDYRGTLTLHDADLEYRPARLALRRVAGPVAIDTLRASSAGLVLDADGSPLRVAGSVIYAGGPWIQVRVTSPALDLARVQALFFPSARIALTGTAGADMAMAGPIQALDIAGEVTGARGTLNGQPFDRARARLQYGAGTLALSDLVSSIGGGRLAGDVVLTSTNGTPSYLFSGDTAEVDVRSLVAIGITGIGKVAGRVSGHVVGVGSGTQVDVMGDIRMARGRFQGLPFSDAHGIFLHRGDGSIALDYLGGRLDGASVYSSGDVSAAGALDLDVLAHGLSLSDVAAQTGAAGGGPLAVIEGQADLAGRARGSLAAPVLSGEATVAHGRLGPAAFAHAHGPVTVSGRSIETSGLLLQNGLTFYRVAGALSFRPLAADGLHVAVDNLPADWVSAALPGAPDMTGTLGGALAIDGPLAHPGIGGRVTLDHGTVARQRIDHAQADLAPDPGRIRITDGEARVNGSRLVARGTVSLTGPVDLALSAQHVRMSDLNTAFGLRLPVDGTLNLNGQVQGTVARPAVSGRVDAPDLTAGAVTFQASGAIAYEDGVLTLSPLQLTQGTSRYSLSGSIRARPEPSAALALDVDQGQVATLLAATGIVLPAPLDGRLDGRITLTGPLDDPEAGLSLRLGHGTFGAYPIGDAVADLTLSHQAIDIQRFQIRPAQGQVAAKGRIDLRGSSAVEVSAQDLNPDFLRPFFHLDRPLQGHLDFTVQFTGPPRDPQAGISLTGTGIGVADVVADRISALAFYRQGQVTLEQAAVSKGQHTMLVGGAIPVDPLTFAFDPRMPLSLALRLQDADLSFLSLLTPKITDASGTVAGEIAVGGTGAAPQMTGFLRSSGGRLHYEALRTPLENLNIDLTFSQDQINVHDLSATLGGGRAAASGTVAVREFRPATVALSLTVDAAKVDAPGLYTGQVDGTLRLAGPAPSPALSGRATLSNGVISPLGLEPGAGGTGTGSAGTASPVPDFRYDVDVDAGRNLVFTAGPVRAQVEGGVHVGGTVARPWLSGRVTSPAGEVAFLGTSFRITGGEALFSQALGVEPQITARAEQIYGDTIVFLDVSGPAGHPTLALSANPPLPQSDIVTLIARNAGLADAEAILGTGIGQYLFTPVREALRLNEFSVSYSQQSPLTLRIGKYLLSNLYLTVSQIWPSSTPLALSATLPFGTFPRQFLAGQSYTVAGLEYFLSQNVLLNFTVDTFGDLGTFVIARFPF